MKFQGRGLGLGFGLLLLACPDIDREARGSDVSLILVKKEIEYSQTTTGSPSVEPTNGYVFEAAVNMTSNNSVTNAAVQPPAPQISEALTLAAAQNKMDAKHKYNSQTKLDSHYPNGTFTVTINGRNDGPRQEALQLLGNLYPAGPHAQNFAALQAVNPNGFFQVKWDAFTGGTTYDYVKFRIEDLSGNKLFETPDLEKTGGLDGTATKTLVAPGYLAGGQTTRAFLTFQLAGQIDRTSYPGALGEAAYAARTTFLLLTTTAPAPEVETFEVYKARKWVQAASNSVAPEAGQEFVFDASVQSYNPGVLTSGSVTLAPTTNPPLRTLGLQPGGTMLDFSDVATTQAALDSFYGSGSYTLNFPTANSGTKLLGLTLPADAFPPAPRISNFDVLQTVNTSRPTLVSWDAWTGGTVNDFVQVRVEDHQKNKIYATPDLGFAGALDGRSTNATIPAGALGPGLSLEIHVTFKKLIDVDTTNYPGVLGVSSFQARTKFNIATYAADARTYSIFKTRGYKQTDPGNPFLLSSNAFGLESRVQAWLPNLVVNASIATPLGANAILVPQPGGQQFYLKSSYASQGALEAVHPNGAYTVNLNGANDGAKSLPLDVQGDLYPNAPRVANFYAAQLVDARSDFVLGWDAFSGGTANDFIQLALYDSGGNSILQTPDFAMAGALNGLATSAAIPRAVIKPSQVYTGQLLFRKHTVDDRSTYPGAEGLAGYASTTQFRVVTEGTGNPTLLSLAQNPTNHRFEISASVLTGLAYQVEGSSNLMQWTPLMTNASGTNLLRWLDPVGRATFFYRASVLP